MRPGWQYNQIHIKHSNNQFELASIFKSSMASQIHKHIQTYTHTYKPTHGHMYATLILTASHLLPPYFQKGIFPLESRMCGPLKLFWYWNLVWRPVIGGSAHCTSPTTRTSPNRDKRIDLSMPVLPEEMHSTISLDQHNSPRPVRLACTVMLYYRPQNRKGHWIFLF